MFNWLRELLEIRYEYREKRTRLNKEEVLCKSCETLKAQLEISNYEKKQLLERILEKPVVEKNEPPVQVTRPHNIPWNVRKQMMEAEDRERARIMREAPKPLTTDELEKELDIATTEREAKIS